MKTVIMFAKYPLPGKVKTRLGESIGMEEAARLQRQWIEEAVQKHSNQEYNFIICCSNQPLLFQRWFPTVQIDVQQGKNLGERMANAFKYYLSHYTEVVLIGCDAPDMDADLAELAFTALKSHDIVLGSDTSGGMYLIGMKQFQDIFTNIAYSQGTDFVATQERCKRLDISINILSPIIMDIDTVQDYEDWQAQFCLITVNPQT